MIFMGKYQVSNIGSGEHYIYYSRLKDSKINNIKNLFNNLASFDNFSDRMNFEALDIYNLLISQAHNERKKEIKVLQKITNGENNEVENLLNNPLILINKLNQAIGLKNKYFQYLQYIKNFRNSDNKEKSFYPVVTNYVNEKLGKLIRDRYGNEIQQVVLEAIENSGDKDPSEAIKKAIDKIVEKITTDFISQDNEITKDLLNQLGETNYTLGENGEYKVWEDLLQQISSDEEIRNEFISSILKNLNLKNKILKAVEDYRKSSKKTSVKSKLKKSITANNSKTSGFHYESLTAAIASIVLKGLTDGKSNNFSISTSKISNIATTDTLALGGFEINFDTQEYIKTKIEDLEKNPYLEGSSTPSKEAAVNAFVEFTNFLKNNINDGFIIYGSNKSYDQNRLKDKEGYFKGGRRNITQLPIVLSQYTGITISDSAIDLIINTIPGAIYSNNNKKEQISEYFSAALAGQMAKLLFDDWTTIGDQVNDNFNAIHVFNLNGVVIPLSFLLEKAAEAVDLATSKLQSAPSSYFQVTFELPESIYFKEPKDTSDWINEQLNSDSKKSKKTTKNKKTLQDAWNYQRDIALKESSFGIDILSNFNNLINQLLNSMN